MGNLFFKDTRSRRAPVAFSTIASIAVLTHEGLAASAVSAIALKSHVGKSRKQKKAANAAKKAEKMVKPSLRHGHMRIIEAKKKAARKAAQGDQQNVSGEDEAQYDFSSDVTEYIPVGEYSPAALAEIGAEAAREKAARKAAREAAQGDQQDGDYVQDGESVSSDYVPEAEIRRRRGA